jgi:hypothetical protein
MMIRETVLPFKLDKTDDTITPLAGLALLGEFLKVLGLEEKVKKVFPRPGRANGYAAWDYVRPLLMMLHAGGRTLEDLRKLGQDEGLRRVLGMDRFPSPDAAGDWLRRMGRAGALSMALVIKSILRGALAGDGRTGYTLDIDATAIEAHKESARRTYKGYPGYFPIVGHLAENGLVVAFEFREGNDSPHARNLEFYLACKQAMPEGKTITAFRADSAAYQGLLLDQLQDDSVAYAVGADLDAAVREAIRSIPPGRWQRYGDGWIAETVHTMNKTKYAFRLVVVRRDAVQGSLFEDRGPLYHVVASNRVEGPAQTMDWYHARGEHSENRIKELKCDFAMERMPCGQFEANALFFALGVLAYNLYKLFEKWVLPEGYRRVRACTVRYRLYAVAGKVVRTGRSLILKVCEAALEEFRLIRLAIATLTPI